MIRPLWVWGPVIAQMAAIFYASSLPDISALPGGISDKVGHFVGYALLGGLMLRAMAGARVSGATPRVALWAFLLSALYGLTDEGHQLLVPGRSAAFDDLVADACGAAVAVAFCWIVTRAVHHRRVRRGEV
jgi:VanZ family protein